MSAPIGIALGLGKIHWQGLVVLVIVTLLSSLLGSSLGMLEVSHSNADPWRRAIRFFVLWLTVPLCLSACIALIALIAPREVSDWLKALSPWVDTPIVMFLLLPIVPFYHAMRAVVEGLTISTFVWLPVLTVLAVLLIREALQSAPQFCEALVTYADLARRARGAAEWETATIAGLKRLQDLQRWMRFQPGFSKGATALLWQLWLGVRRSKSAQVFGLDILAVVALLVAAFLGLLGTEYVFGNWTRMQVAVGVVAFWVFLSPAALPFRYATNELMRSLPIPRWQKVFLPMLPFVGFGVFAAAAILGAAAKVGVLATWLPIVLFLPAGIAAVAFLAQTAFAPSLRSMGFDLAFLLALTLGTWVLNYPPNWVSAGLICFVCLLTFLAALHSLTADL